MMDMSISDSSSLSTRPLLQIQDLTVSFPTEVGPAKAVQHLSLTLEKGKILGLVGESGCGKSMTSLAVLGLIPNPGSITQGQIWFEGQDLATLKQQELQKIRGAKIAIIPQDPLTSLNPVYTIGNQMREVLELHRGMNRKEAEVEAIRLLDLVRLPNAKERIHDYPHQFSGGMRQRVMIAMALSCSPELLIADEPTTALDVTVQAQILDLMQEIQKEHGTAILLITHDLGVVAEICDEVAVMYAGRIIEQAPVVDLFKKPKHPYTQGLLNSLPTMNRKRLEPVDGSPPTITEIPDYCAFVPRCSKAFGPCSQIFPDRTKVSEHHGVYCHLYSHPESPLETGALATT
jgi:oligopeptide/dipeptide ABC transporter ATP-binding protein